MTRKTATEQGQCTRITAACKNHRLDLAEHRFVISSPRFNNSSFSLKTMRFTLDAVNQFILHRRSPNGYSVKMTYFTSLTYTTCILVSDWSVAGNEIAGSMSVQRFLSAFPKICDLTLYLG